MMPTCKKSEFMLGQVCPQDDQKTTCFLNGIQIDKGKTVMNLREP